MSEKITIKLPESKRGRKSKQDKLIYESQLRNFAHQLEALQYKIAGRTVIYETDKVSARGWCYLLEGEGLITKDQFDYAQKLINVCRREGYLAIDFVALDKSREFSNVGELTKDPEDPKKWILSYLGYFRDLHKRKNDVVFWESQEYYIQMMVEKIDISNLFSGICKKYHIPIANAKGWSDMNSRNQLAQRFKEAEELGLKPVLLYYGDFDPAGILIADVFKKNLKDLEKATHWDPENLIVDKFGLTFDFIEDNNLLWIDNLITGSKKMKKDLSDPRHPDHKKPYVQDYIKKYGVRKCEANAILPIKNAAKRHCLTTIHGYLGDNPFDTYKEKLADGKADVKEYLDNIDFQDRIDKMIEDIKNVD